VRGRGGGRVPHSEQKPVQTGRQAELKKRRVGSSGKEDRRPFYLEAGKK